MQCPIKECIYSAEGCGILEITKKLPKNKCTYCTTQADLAKKKRRSSKDQDDDDK